MAMSGATSADRRRLSTMFLASQLSASLIGSFLPAYYLILGAGGMTWAVEYLIAFFVGLALVPNLALKVAPARFEQLTFASFFASMAYNVLLIAGADPWLTGAVAGTAAGLFWPPVQSMIVRLADERRQASTFGTVWLLGLSVAGMLGPLAGGVIVSLRGGFAIGLSVSAAMYFAAFLLMRGFHFARAPRTDGPEERFGPRRLRYFWAAVVGWGVTDVSWFAYPLFTLHITKTFVNMGIVLSAIGVVTAVAGIGLGRVTDRLRNRHTVISLGVVLNSAWLLILPFVNSPAALVASSVVLGMATAAWAPTMVGWMTDSYTTDSVHSFFARYEIPLTLGRGVNLAIMAVLLASGNYGEYFTVCGLLGLTALPAFYKFSKLSGEGTCHRPAGGGPDRHES